MIWVGRAFSIPVGVVFFAFLLVALVLLRVDDTFLDTDFYPEELRKANIYEFVLVDLLTSALDEARELDQEGFGERLDENPLITSGLSTEDIVRAINTAVPPDWVQGLVEQSFDQIGRYLTGERDQFEVTIRAGDQVATLVSEIKGLLRKADAYELLYTEVVEPAITDAVDVELPLGVEFEAERLIESVRAIVPPEWVQSQVEGVLDEVTPYLIGDRATFEINVQLADRAEIALEEARQLLREANAYELLYNEVVEPKLIESLGDSVELPIGVSVTAQEVLSALRRVAPPEWVQQQVEMVIDAATPYLTGETDAFNISVSLAENKLEAREIIVELTSRKTRELVDAIPKCENATQAESALRNRDEQSLPTCVPKDIPADKLLSSIGIDIPGSVTSFVLDAIPNVVTFTESQLRAELVSAGAEENLDRVNQVREILRDGWTYTQDDLHEDLSDENIETLEDVRAFLADGWTYTHSDLRQLVAEDGDGATLDNFDQGQDYFKLARTYRWIVYVPMALLLVVIAFMGGRTWSGRVAYTAFFLLVSAGIIFLVFGPGYGSFAKSGPIYDAAGLSDLDELREDALTEIEEGAEDFPGTARLAAGKAFDMAESVADGFASSIARSSLTLAIIGLLAMGAAILWSVLTGAVRRYVPEAARLFRSRSR